MLRWVSIGGHLEREFRYTVSKNRMVANGGKMRTKAMAVPLVHEPGQPPGIREGGAASAAPDGRLLSASRPLRPA
jgi:hypothetical protein